MVEAEDTVAGEDTEEVAEALAEVEAAVVDTAGGEAEVDGEALVVHDGKGLQDENETCSGFSDGAEACNTGCVWLFL